MLFQYNNKYFGDLKTRQFPNRDESVFDYVVRREQLFYEKLYLPFNLKLTGNPEKPALILNDTYNISGYLNGFTLLIFDSPESNANLLLKYNLDNRQLPRNVFENNIKTGIHKAVYKLQHDSGLYLSGRNFTDKLNKRGVYPVYSNHDPIIFLNMVSAASELTKYDKEISIKSINQQNKLDLKNFIFEGLIRKNDIFICEDLLIVPYLNDVVSYIDADEVIVDYEILENNEIILYGELNDYPCRIYQNDISLHKVYF